MPESRLVRSKARGFESWMRGGVESPADLHIVNWRLALATDAEPLADRSRSKDSCKFWTRGEIWRDVGYLRLNV